MKCKKHLLSLSVSDLNYEVTVVPKYPHSVFLCKYFYYYYVWTRKNERVQCVFQVRLPTGTVIHVKRVGGVFLNTVIYLSTADYNQTEGKITKHARWWGMKYLLY